MLDPRDTDAKKDPDEKRKRHLKTPPMIAAAARAAGLGLEMTMDGQRFDAWTRALARGLPRRGALKVVAGMAVAGATTRFVQREAAACTATAGATCDPTFGCCADLGLPCLGSPGTGTCVVVGSPSCATLVTNTNQCVNAPIVDHPSCEGKGCKKKDKKDKKRKKKHGR